MKEMFRNYSKKLLENSGMGSLNNT